jgi:polyferredoxin
VAGAARTLPKGAGWLKTLTWGWLVLTIVGSLALVFSHASLYTAEILYLVILIGMTALSIARYIVLPRRRRGKARRLIILLMGLVLLYVALASGRGNMQLEGLLFALLISLTHPSVIHFALAKILGPFGFGRLWCGWACWFAAVFDQLPYSRSRGRLHGAWGHLRYLGFAISVGLVVLLWHDYRYTDGADGRDGLLWFLAGLALYLASGVALAYALKDNRAFCKYLCPNSVLLKTGAHLSPLRVGGDASRCNDCGACNLICPMDIRISDYIQQGQRVLSTECTLCQTCVWACPKDALALSFAFDPAHDERLRLRHQHPHLDWIRGLKLRRLGLPWKRPSLHDL